MPSLRRLVVLLFLVLPSAAMACDPCFNRISLSKSITRASLIVQVVNRDRNSSSNMTQGPEYVNLTVEKVLKGEPDDAVIKVHSWYGECVYGVHLALNERAVLLLEESTDILSGGFDGSYKLVEDGCSEGQLEMKGNKLRVADGWTSVDAFQSGYVSR